ncbi:MAG TPA: helix-turn-helix domain-containing protein [Gaiellaceae bacterium]|nr:helix-turn-helix domain-containing protein [Gaiellaceae bacterium]
MTPAAPQPIDEAFEGSLVSSLGELGLTPNQSRAYVALLRHESATATEVALAASVPRPKIYDVLQSLERAGLCASGGGRVSSWTAVPPDIALPDLVRRREHERRLQADRDQELAAVLADSLPKPVRAAPEPEAPLIEALIGRPRIAEAFERLVTTTERTLDIVQAMPIVQHPERWNVLEAAAIERGVEVRVLFTPEAAKSPERWRSLLVAGGEGRLSNNLALKLAIRDGEEALVALRDPSYRSHDDDGITSIRIVQPDLVAPLQTLFRREWRRGSQLPQPREAKRP